MSKSKRLARRPPQLRAGAPADAVQVQDAALPAAPGAGETHAGRDAQSTSTVKEVTAKYESKTQFWILLQLRAGAGMSLARVRDCNVSREN